MKKRTKRLWLMAMLVALVGGGTNGTVAAMSLNRANLLSGGLDVAQTLALTSAEETPIWDINKDEGVMETLSLDGENGLFYFTVKAPVGWRLGSVKVVYRDYEEGITEQMADEAARTLGEDDDDWAVLVTEATTFSNDCISGRLVQFSFEKGTLKKNLTNEFYYAVKLVNQNDQNDVTWKRGKLSYRRCAKTPEFVEKTMRCTMWVENGYHTPVLRKSIHYGGGALEMIAEDEIEDWDTEWGKELRKRYNQVVETLNGTDKYLRQFVANMKSVDTLLSGLEKTQNSASGIEDIASDLESRKAQLASLRSYYASLLGSGASSDELTNLQQQNRDLQDKNQDLTAKNQSLTTQNQELETQNATLLAKIAELTTGGDDAATKISELQKDKADLMSQVAALETEVERLRAATDTDLLNTVTELEKTNNTLVSTNRDLESANNTLENEKKSLAKQSDELAARLADEEKLNQELLERINSLGGGCVTEVMAASLIEGSSNDTSVSGEAPNDQTESAVTTALPSSAASTVDAEKTDDTREVDVPRLGSNNLNVWLGIALLALALGVLLLWLKRVISN